MKQERIKALKAQVEAHYKGKKREVLIDDIANMSSVLEEQHAMLNQLYETKAAALWVAQSVIDHYKGQGLPPPDLDDKIAALKLSEIFSNQLFITGAFQYGAANSRKEQARNAINARHDKKGGYRDIKAQLLDIWDTGKYKHYTTCARAEHEKLGIGYEAALGYLKGAPKHAEQAKGNKK